MFYCLLILLSFHWLFSQLRMIGFVTWPPFILSSDRQKDGQVTKPIIAVKIISVQSNKWSTNKQ